MPRIKPLSSAQQREADKQKSNEAFRDAVVLFKSRNQKTDEQIAEKLGCCRVKLSRMRKDPGKATLNDVRIAMHFVGAAPEDWLRLGGFRVN